jgi:hypothetical protein
VDRIAKAALAEKPDAIILVHGGPGGDAGRRRLHS